MGLPAAPAIIFWYYVLFLTFVKVFMLGCWEHICVWKAGPRWAEMHLAPVSLIQSLLYAVLNSTEPLTQRLHWVWPGGCVRFIVRYRTATTTKQSSPKDSGRWPWRPRLFSLAMAWERCSDLCSFLDNNSRKQGSFLGTVSRSCFLPCRHSECLCSPTSNKYNEHGVFCCCTTGHPPLGCHKE